MTKLINETKTYSLVDGHMVHTGYFIVTDNHRLKYATKWVWESAKAMPLFKLNFDHIVSRLQSAQ
jgi:hypothetical protein